MFRLWILVLLAVAAGAAIPAQRKNISPRGGVQESIIQAYLEGVCEESYNWTEPSRPCEVAEVINYQCVTGLDWDVNADQQDQVASECWDTQGCQSPDFQRTCYCQSQYIDTMIGCHLCALEHGGGGLPGLNSFDWNQLVEIMDEYCDPTFTPTAAFANYILPAYSAVESTSSTSFSDLLGYKKTEVSRYYTPSMTGVEAWSTSLSTIEDWNDDHIEAYITADPSDTTSITADADDTTTSTSFSITRFSGTTTSSSTATSSSTMTSFNAPTPPHPTSESSVVSTAHSTIFTGSTHSQSFVQLTSASCKNGVGGIVGILSFLAMVALL
jgi:hypothetical protein